MKVKLLDPNTVEMAKYALYKTAYAMTTCTMNEEKLDPEDSEKHTKLIKTLLDNGHTSVLEHLNYTFEISEITRALLQELSRHRHTSPTVQSTRWALKKIGDNLGSENFIWNLYFSPFDGRPDVTLEDIKRYNVCIEEILLLRKEFAHKYGNDVAKYLTPECAYTKEILTINARSLLNMMELRTSSRALKEFQDLMKAIYIAIPECHKFIYSKFFENKD